MAIEINACGLSCPQPVLMFLNAAKKGDADAFDVLVDTDASRENVTRAATNRGFNVEEESLENGVTRLKITKS